MTALLVVILVCFIVVAIKGLLDWRTWLALGQGLVPQLPAPCPSSAPAHARRLHADHGHRRSGAAARGVPVLRLSGGQRRLQGNGGGDSRRLLEDGAEPRRHLGPLLRRGHRRGRHGAARGVHRHRSELPRREPLLADREHPGGRSGARAGVPGSARLSRAALLLGRSHRRRVHHADLRVADDDLLLSRHGAEELALHGGQPARSRWCSRSGSRSPALVAPFWQLPALLKAIIAMVGNLLLAPGRGARDHVLRQPAESRRVPRQRRPQHRPRPHGAVRAGARHQRSAWGCCDGRGPRGHRP